MSVLRMPLLIAAAAAVTLIVGACTPPINPTVPPATVPTVPTVPGGPPTSAPGGGGAVSPLPAGAITLVTLGDSLTEGTGDDRGIGYPGRLQNELAGRGRAGSVAVNLGHSGWDSQTLIDGHGGVPSELTEARAAVARSLAEGRPAVATVLIGSNDLWYLYEYGPAGDTPAADEVTDLARYRANLDTIVGGLRGAGAQVVVAVNDDQSRRRVAADDSVRAATFPGITRNEVGQMSAQSHRYRDEVRAVAATHGALVGDFLDSPIFTNASTMAEDGNHPNAAGYDQMTAAWLVALGPLLG